MGRGLSYRLRPIGSSQGDPFGSDARFRSSPRDGMLPPSRCTCPSRIRLRNNCGDHHLLRRLPPVTNRTYELLTSLRPIVYTVPFPSVSFLLIAAYSVTARRRRHKLPNPRIGDWSPTPAFAAR
jgi:hypothetical protein